jgi:pyrroline-5-carboxylate reductase
MTPLEQPTIGFIGAGQMARALAGGFVRNEIVTADRILASDAVVAATDSFVKQIPGAAAAASNAELVAAADVVVLAVKPQNATAVFGQLEGTDTAAKLFVSIVAGLPCRRLTEGLGTERIVRVMPNTPCLIGHGMSAYSRGCGASAADAAFVKRLLESVGQAVELDESDLDAVTGLSGSGPAFVYQAIDAMIEGGVRMGLAPATASELAVQTVVGAALMVRQTGDSPTTLTERVASPHGTTVAGLRVLAQKNFKSSLSGAVEAATRRSLELGAE